MRIPPFDQNQKPDSEKIKLLEVELFKPTMASVLVFHLRTLQGGSMVSDFECFLFDQLEISSDEWGMCRCSLLKVCVKSKQTVCPMPHSLQTSCREAPGHLDVLVMLKHQPLPNTTTAER